MEQPGDDISEPAEVFYFARQEVWASGASDDKDVAGGGDGGGGEGRVHDGPVFGEPGVFFTVEASGAGDGGVGECFAVVFGGGDGGADTVDSVGAAEDEGPAGAHGQGEAVDEGLEGFGAGGCFGDVCEEFDLAGAVDGAGEGADGVDLDAVDGVCCGDEGVGEAAGG